ncbi:MAG: prepilin-type N-terminal cleavage/methylation domain-containing protein [Candidatus Pacebacteria bacterium]|nr:prepilin-type N-terminal cleavage/methylation domain-containing protein [Candidatus Paceibacterota bacterium]
MLNKNKKNNKKGQVKHHFLNVSKNGAGFTIIEIMAVLLIISIGMVSIIGVISKIYSQGRYISSKLTAAYLAQEGIEIVRNIRDTNWIEGESWNNDIVVGDRQVDYNDQVLSAYQPDAFLQLNGGFYNYGAGSNTKFKRKITIANPDVDEILITVIVYWEDYEVKTMAKLYEWR